MIWGHKKQKRSVILTWINSRKNDWQEIILKYMFSSFLCIFYSPCFLSVSVSSNSVVKILLTNAYIHHRQPGQLLQGMHSWPGCLIPCHNTNWIKVQILFMVYFQIFQWAEILIALLYSNKSYVSSNRFSYSAQRFFFFYGTHYLALDIPIFHYMKFTAF